MSHPVDVKNNSAWVKAWANFVNKEWIHSSYTSFDECLEKWHGRDLCGTDFIEFRSEHDAIIFLLKWSNA